ncbi:MAG: hypothetical protein Q7T37_01495 [bacterium]|nr:hypothetical protein [bacterium]MDO8742307.1 hypothetical protein [bacterium]
MSLELPDLNPKPLTSEIEKQKSEKEIFWEQKVSRANEIVDGLGKGIDENIKDAIVAFSVHGFTTSASCEGHSGEDPDDGNSPFPWIEVSVPEPEGWEEDEAKRRECYLEELKLQQKMLPFLEEFYRDRETPFDAKLTFSQIGFSGFHVQSFGAKLMDLLTPKEQAQKREIYRKEMRDFAVFLKGKYFSS